MALSWNGTGKQKTEAFQLPAGAYEATWSFKGECAYYTAIRPTENPALDPHDIGNGDGPVDGTNNLYGVESGNYYVDVNTGPSPNCAWAITLAKN